MNRCVEYGAAVLVLLLGWQIAAVLTGPMIVAPPAAVVSLLTRELQSLQFWGHLQASLWRVLAALILSFLSAVPLGLWLGSHPRADRWARPLIYLSYPVPKIVLLPLMLLTFGIGDTGKVAVIALILFFQLLITARDAAREVDRQAEYSLLSLGGSGLDMFRHVIWPACLPAVFTALRVATGTMMAVLFFVESIGTREGLGFYILDAWGRAATPQIFVGMVALGAVGMLFYELFDLGERWFCRWKHAGPGSGR